METMQEIRGSEFTEFDLSDLKIAKAKLENPHLVARLANLIGMPVEEVIKHLPRRAHNKIGETTEAALQKGLEFAISTISDTETKRARGSRDLLHKVLVAGSGIVGGVVGFAGLLAELPVSTCIILRSIADIARSEGHDISRLDVQLSCLEVFYVGSPSKTDNAAEQGYWAVRAALTKTLRDAATHIAEKGFAEQGAPPLAKLIAKIASRYSTVLTQQVAAKSIPIVGAVAGGTINVLFITHYQDMARGHFIVKRLEAKYGTELVMEKYAECEI